MKFTPANGFLLVTPCEDPFEKGPLSVVRDGMLMHFGKVVKSDSTRAYAAPGSVVFYLGSSAVKIVLDREEVFEQVHEGQVMGFISAENAAAVAAKATQLTAEQIGRKPQTPPIVVAPASALVD